MQASSDVLILSFYKNTTKKVVICAPMSVFISALFPLENRVQVLKIHSVYPVCNIVILRLSTFINIASMLC